MRPIPRSAASLFAALILIMAMSGTRESKLMKTAAIAISRTSLRSLTIWPRSQ